VDRAAEGHPAGPGARGGDRVEHRWEVGGDRELVRRGGELAGLDQAPGGADGEGARNGVDAGVEARDVGDVDAVARLRDEVVEGLLAGSDDQVRGRDRGRGAIAGA